MVEKIIGIVLRVLISAFEKSRIDAERKKLFLQFILAYEKMGNGSLKHKNEVERQLEELENEGKPVDKPAV